MELLISAVVALGSAWLFEALRVPGGAMIGAMIGVAGLQLANVETASIPDPVRVVAYAAVGWVVGQGVDRSIFVTLRASAVPIAVTVLTLLIVGGLLAWALTRTGTLDPLTAFLSASPGGMAQMSIISAEVGAQASIVATIHLIRVVLVLLIAPVVAQHLPSPP